MGSFPTLAILKHRYIIGPLSSFILFFLFLVSLSSVAQNEDKKWMFGSAAGLDFVTNPPTPITTSSMFGYREGTASVADAIGNLSFYTDGVTIWDKNNQVMANGTGLLGSIVTTQAALIVKQPGTSSIYIIFTLGPTGLFYSTVNMSLAAGLGSVTAVNISVAGASAEKLTGTRHCNGIDTWIVSHEYGSNVFRSHLVTAVGVSSSATLSPIGSVWNNRYHSYGGAKISQNGKRLACGVYYNTSNFSNFELYDFDNSTGVISNQVVLAFPLNVPPVPPSTNPAPPPHKLPSPSVLFSYGLEFSPDGSKFYGTGVTDSVMYQWNLCAGSYSAIVNSRFKITSLNSSAMQLAKDGKIYVARLNKQMLGVINNPNQAGAACNYVAQAQSIVPALCSYGLPNFISEPPKIPFTYFINGSVSCNSATLSAPPPPTVTLTGCTSTGYNITSFVWYFGDPASGAANTSTLTNPVHVYPGQGTYTASLVYTYNNSCGGVNTDTLKQEVKIGVLPVISSAGFNLCTGYPLVLSAPGAQTHSWSTGVTTSSILADPPSTTTYTVSGIDLAGCPYISVQTVNVYSSPTLAITGQTTICPGFQIKLKAYGANTYSWSSGSTNSLNMAIQAATKTYTLYGNSNGCIEQKTITVKVQRPDVLISGGNVTVCPGAPVTLTVSGASNYAWSTGAQSTTVIVTPSVTTTFSVQGMNGETCINTDSTLITIGTQSAAIVFSYTPVCERTPTLNPIPGKDFASGGFYSSIDFPVDPTTGVLDLSSTIAGTYFVNYYLPKQACLDSAQSIASVTVFPSPPVNVSKDQNISPGSSATLSVSGGISYTWSPADFLSCTNCSAPVATPPESTVYCVISDLGSCIAKTCVSVAVTCETSNDYSVPNAFTPNGDGTNDEFCLRGWNVCLISFNVLIYNQWGENVFESSDPDFCWDGVYKGRLMGASTFVYVIRAMRFDKTPVSKKGNIMLLR